MYQLNETKTLSIKILIVLQLMHLAMWLVESLVAWLVGSSFDIWNDFPWMPYPAVPVPALAGPNANSHITIQPSMASTCPVWGFTPQTTSWARPSKTQVCQSRDQRNQHDNTGDNLRSQSIKACRDKPLIIRIRQDNVVVQTKVYTWKIKWDPGLPDLKFTSQLSPYLTLPIPKQR